MNLSAAGSDGVVIVLPDGGALGGVTTWAKTTVRALESIDCSVAVVGPNTQLHEWGERVAHYHVADTVDGIRDGVCKATSELFTGGTARVIVLPQLSGVAFAGSQHAAHLVRPATVEVWGWMHTDIRHDIELIRRFAPGLTRVVCVSRASQSALHKSQACDLHKLHVLPTGCERWEVLQPDAKKKPGGTLRLLYVGRVEAFQKRAICLPFILSILVERGVNAQLTVVGDGPALPSLNQTIKKMRLAERVSLLGKLEQSDLAQQYQIHDLLVQPSRSEGLGLARIEAAMLGCVPVVTPGGSQEGITPGVDGLVVNTPNDADDKTVAAAFAQVISNVSPADIERMSANAMTSATQAFSMERYAHSLGELLMQSQAGGAEQHAWADITRDPSRAADFTVPSDVHDPIKRLSDVSSHRAIVLHGAGRHTEAIWRPLHEAGFRVIAITDDDPRHHGTEMFGVPVVRPADLPAEAEAVVISSWMHEDAIWSRRAIYQDQGVTVLRLYESCDDPAGSEMLSQPR